MIGATKMMPFGWPTVDHLDRNGASHGSFWMVAACLVALAVSFIPGCANSSVAYPVDAPQARDALKIALDAWKKGETSKSLASSSTPMTVQDFECDTGAKLIEYRLVDEGRADGPNLRIQVRLTTGAGPVKGQKVGKPVEKTASYVVGTSPRLTVFRDIMRR